RHRDIQQVMVFLQGHGISPAFAHRIWRAYGHDAVRRVRENTYQLAIHIPGIGFKTADAIARSLGLSGEVTTRVAAGLHHAVREVAGNGTLYVAREAVRGAAVKALEVDPAALAAPLAALASGRHAVADGDRIYLSGLYRAETSLAQALV